jgi:microcystin-dependent protein
MGDYYIGEIVTAGFNFAPLYFLPCDGRQLQISEYSTLFALIGNRFGGDGVTNFNLPNLNGRAAAAAGSGSYILGASGGEETVTLASNSMPGHTHTVNCDPSPQAPVPTPASNVPAGAGSLKPYVTAPDTATMYAAMIQSVGNGQAHENRQPFQCLNVFICVEGIWPPRP